MNWVLIGLTLFVAYTVIAVIYYWVGCFIWFKRDKQFSHFCDWYYAKSNAPDRESILVQSIVWPFLTFIVWPIGLTIYGLIKLVSFPMKTILGGKIMRLEKK